MASRKQILAEIQNTVRIDLSKYNTVELLERVENLLTTIPKAKFRLILTPIFCLIPMIVFGIVYYISYQHTFAFWMIEGILLSDAFFIGEAVAILLVVRSFIRNIDQILVISLETTSQIIKDILSATEFQSKEEIDLPKGSAILKIVAIGILLPQIEKYIRKKIFLISGIYRWVAEKIIVTATLNVSNFIEKKIESSSRMQKLDTQIENLEAKLNEKIRQINVKIQKLQAFAENLYTTSRQISKFSLMAKRFISFPLYIFILIFYFLSAWAISILFSLMTT